MKPSFLPILQRDIFSTAASSVANALMPGSGNILASLANIIGGHNSGTSEDWRGWDNLDIVKGNQARYWATHIDKAENKAAAMSSVINYISYNGWFYVIKPGAANQYACTIQDILSSLNAAGLSQLVPQVQQSYNDWVNAQNNYSTNGMANTNTSAIPYQTVNSNGSNSQNYLPTTQIPVTPVIAKSNTGAIIAVVAVVVIVAVALYFIFKPKKP